MFYYSVGKNNSMFLSVDRKRMVAVLEKCRMKSIKQGFLHGYKWLNKAARITMARTVEIQRFSTALLLNLTSRYLYAGESCFRCCCSGRLRVVCTEKLFVRENCSVLSLFTETPRTKMILNSAFVMRQHRRDTGLFVMVT